MLKFIAKILPNEERTLYEDWKSDCHILGPSVRQWDPNPPPDQELDLRNIQLKLAKITKDPTKKGWQAYQISVSNEVRQQHLQDPVNAPTWKELITDFDRKLLVKSTWAEGVLQ